jgi:hypothetical protein
MSLNGGQFRVCAGRELRLETVLDHGGVGGGDKIEMHRLGRMHTRQGSFECEGQG